MIIAGLLALLMMSAGGFRKPHSRGQSLRSPGGLHLENIDFQTLGADNSYITPQLLRRLGPKAPLRRGLCIFALNLAPGFRLMDLAPIRSGNCAR